MSTIRRDFRASPHRTGCETWEAIAHVLAPSDDSVGRKELLAVTGVAAQLISTETARHYPIISAGSGSQVRIYCIYDEDALDEDNANEAALAFDATSGDWRVSIPAEAEDVSWSSAELSKLSARISVREKTETLAEEEGKESSAGLKVDLSTFLNE